MKRYSYAYSNQGWDDKAQFEEHVTRINGDSGKLRDSSGEYEYRCAEYEYESRWVNRHRQMHNSGMAEEGNHVDEVAIESPTPGAAASSMADPANRFFCAFPHRGPRQIAE